MYTSSTCNEYCNLSKSELIIYYIGATSIHMMLYVELELNYMFINNHTMYILSHALGSCMHTCTLMHPHICTEFIDQKRFWEHIWFNKSPY